MRKKEILIQVDLYLFICFFKVLLKNAVEKDFAIAFAATYMNAR